MLALAVVFAAVLSGEPPPAGEVLCDLVKVRAEERRLGVTPAGEEANSGDATGAETGAFQFLTLQCKDRRFVVRFVGDLPTVESKASKPSVLTVSFEAEKVFIRWPGGKAIEARYATVETPRPAKPAPPTKK